MLAEALEWLVTPCPWSARWSGALARQIAIRHRYRRCHAAWAPHLVRSRAVIQSHSPATPGSLVVVLGSGHLHDVPCPPSGVRSALVDLVHPLEIQIRAALSRGRFVLYTADVANPSADLRSLIATADLCISVGLLSQLALSAPVNSGFSVARQHWKLLSSARRALLVTDVAARTHPGEAWDPLFDASPLPASIDEWVWTLIPPGESPAGPQERRVQVFAP